MKGTKRLPIASPMNNKVYVLDDSDFGYTEAADNKSGIIPEKKREASKNKTIFINTCFGNGAKKTKNTETIETIINILDVVNRLVKFPQIKRPKTRLTPTPQRTR